MISIGGQEGGNMREDPALLRGGGEQGSPKRAEREKKERLKST